MRRGWSLSKGGRLERGKGGKGAPSKYKKSRTTRITGGTGSRKLIPGGDYHDRNGYVGIGRRRAWGHRVE